MSTKDDGELDESWERTQAYWASPEGVERQQQLWLLSQRGFNPAGNPRVLDVHPLPCGPCCVDDHLDCRADCREPCGCAYCEELRDDA